MVCGQSYVDLSVPKLWFVGSLGLTHSSEAVAEEARHSPKIDFRPTVPHVSATAGCVITNCVITTCIIARLGSPSFPASREKGLFSVSFQGRDTKNFGRDAKGVGR